MIKRISNQINISDFIITFSYETYKGYYREQQRIVRSFNTNNAKLAFNSWINNQRTMSNVQILGVVKIDNTDEVIAL